MTTTVYPTRIARRRFHTPYGDYRVIGVRSEPTATDVPTVLVQAMRYDSLIFDQPMPVYRRGRLIARLALAA